MRSKTKNMLTQEQIKILVRANFGNTCRVDNITELKGQAISF